VTGLVRLALGAPGVYYRAPASAPALTAERMDVCAFVGIAPRGPARIGTGPGTALAQPVAVESWNEYRRLYGGFEGPGLLPYAVAAFFENGGRRAYIVRVVHDYRRADGTVDADAVERLIAAAPLQGIGVGGAVGAPPLWVRARNEGRWGNALQAKLSFERRPLALPGLEPSALLLPLRHDLVVGGLLRVTGAGAALSLVRIRELREEWADTGRGERRVRAVLDRPIVPADVRAVELIEGELTVWDGADRSERFSGLGLSPAHQRWLARVLLEESDLLLPGVNRNLPPGHPLATWDEGRELAIDPALRPCATAPFRGFGAGPVPAEDGYRDITHDDFIAPGWVPGDDTIPRGIHALVELPDLSLLAVPDLYAPGALAPVTPADQDTGAGARFQECVHPALIVPTPPVEQLEGLLLDPVLDLGTILAWQEDLVRLADQLAGVIALLDVPPGLPDRTVHRWRDRFESMYAAAYHPWCRVARLDDGRNEAIRVPPSAAAAGLIARSEIDFSLPRGPANLPVRGVFGVTDRISIVRHDALHPLGINVFRTEPNGIWLTAARTLSRDRPWRQLSVRRLMTMLRRTLLRQMQWAVFEPNGEKLWDDVRSAIESLLAELFRLGAFAGARREEAYFVRCDRTTMTRNDLDNGRLVCLVGVAPAEPIEFIVVQLVRDGDGTLRITE
jgi:hypothetical protein